MHNITGQQDDGSDDDDQDGQNTLNALVEIVNELSDAVTELEKNVYAHDLKLKGNMLEINDLHTEILALQNNIDEVYRMVLEVIERVA